MSMSSLLQHVGLWTLARYAQRAIVFVALPSRDEARSHAAHRDGGRMRLVDQVASVRNGDAGVRARNGLASPT
jgi:hypothetical protein